jgi:Pyridoxamine 5'-phosphate oxidase
MFFLATADADGRPDCSYKGGKPGFVRVVAADTLAFPSYDGNGMFRVSATCCATRRSAHEPPVPAWKQMDAFKDYLPRPTGMTVDKPPQA